MNVLLHSNPGDPDNLAETVQVVLLLLFQQGSMHMWVPPSFGQDQWLHVGHGSPVFAIASLSGVFQRLLTIRLSWAVVAHTFNPGTQEAKAGMSLKSSWLTQLSPRTAEDTQ